MGTGFVMSGSSVKTPFSQSAACRCPVCTILSGYQVIVHGQMLCFTPELILDILWKGKKNGKITPNQNLGDRLNIDVILVNNFV